MMDQAAIEASKALASGDVKFVLAAGLLLALGVAGWLGRTLFAEIKACNAQMLDLTAKKIESDNKLAGALEGLEKVVETALRVPK